MEKVRIGLIGGGWISAKHIEASKHVSNGQLVALCDIDPSRKVLADALGIPFFTDYRELLSQAEVEGVIDATPNPMHSIIGGECAERGIHVLTEKPVTATLKEGKALVETVRQSGIHLLVGHHRRHFPLVKRAREIVRGGELGQLVGVSIIWALMKGDAYYLPEWRSLPGGGPVMCNMIHEIDNLRYICGDIFELTARTKRLVRKGQVEDTISMNFEMTCGALGAAVVSDTTPAPWSYELSSGENPDFFKNQQNCYHYLGSKASLSFPDLHLYSYAHGSTKGWWEPLMVRSETVPYFCPYTAQLEHFCRVIQGREEPIINAADALLTLATTLSVLESSETGRTVSPRELLENS
ncbi:Gfo/Idh/MocA family protein [Pelobacter seleniigenes]|uniref:Gfo/Idh/MocA family protein n=1 Tax=Pelobacter seleniigenes TaxID=407188 RepID=UPI0004A71E1C|nr:Gfo/Idh/MocA family oxidoreductase [Pelobacter seleniigenes]